MRIDEYLDFLFKGKKEEANQIRFMTIPDKLVKFIWLDGSMTDEKKYITLKNEEIWFAHKNSLNDPYEYQGMLLDQHKLLEAGYTINIIEEYQKLFDLNEYGITCFSSNSVDYLPMWAYYTNNHKGFCIEYDVMKKDCIHEVLYEPERIKVASLIFQSKEAVKHAIATGDTRKADFFTALFLQNLFIKAKAWEHEKEYRIVYPLDNNVGKNVPVHKLGIRTSRIVAGINCSDKDIERLNTISNDLGLGNVYRSKIHKEKYTIDIVR